MVVYYHLNVDFEAFKVKPFKDMLHLNLQLNLLWSGNFVDIKSHKPMKRSKEINQEKKIINWVTNILRKELKDTPNALPGKKVSLFQEKSL